jgi:hypothetical protein
MTSISVFQPVRISFYFLFSFSNTKQKSPFASLEGLVSKFAFAVDVLSRNVACYTLVTTGNAEGKWVRHYLKGDGEQECGKV